MIISFAYTTPALLAGAKTVTRRDWSADYADKFHVGDVIQAWDKNPRIHGRHVADVRLTEAPYYESIVLMPDGDYVGEGFEWLHAHPGAVNTRRFGKFSREDFLEWRFSGMSFFVVRFELVRVHEALDAWLARRGLTVGVRA